MFYHFTPRHSMALLVALLAPLSACEGTTPEPEDTPERAFPDGAPSVLGLGSGFAPVTVGFAAWQGAGFRNSGGTATLPLLADPIWSSASQPMGSARGRHTATLLQDGRVLVVGGRNPVVLNTAELFDPATQTFSATTSMGTSRRDHTATLLSDGRVLVVGGMNASGVYLASAEIFDPVSETWASAGSMADTRYVHTATRLQDGRVLIVGGSGDAGTLDSAELYAPAPAPSEGIWTLAQPLPGCPTPENPPPTGNRRRHTATLLTDGRVLVAGGEYGAWVGLESAAIYDPSADTWSCTPGMALPHTSHTATLLPSGKVLIVGYNDLNDPNEIYDPASDTWTSDVPPVPYGQPTHHIAELLPGGVVLVAGGKLSGGQTPNSSTSDTAIYNPDDNTWLDSPSMTTGHAYHAAARLDDGRVLVTGGGDDDNGYIDTAEIFASGELGAPCTIDGNCQSGFCADGVCCDSACDGGGCNACSVVKGADEDGTCKLFNGASCDDGNLCTQTDTCQAGACVGANPITCSAPGECYEDGECVPETGHCTDRWAPEGTLCTGGYCSAGTCFSEAPQDPPSTSPEDSDAPRPPPEEEGASCRAGAGTSDHAAWWLLAVLGLLRRQRRATPRTASPSA